MHIACSDLKFNDTCGVVGFLIDNTTPIKVFQFLGGSWLGCGNLIFGKWYESLKAEKYLSYVM